MCEIFDKIEWEKPGRESVPNHTYRTYASVNHTEKLQQDHFFKQLTSTVQIKQLIKETSTNNMRKTYAPKAAYTKVLVPYI